MDQNDERDVREERTEYLAIREADGDQLHTSAASHTPGPWRCETWTYDEGAKRKSVIQTDTDAIAELYSLYRGDDDPMPEVAANARLIAAAPELLYLVREFRSIIEATYGHDDETNERDEAMGPDFTGSEIVDFLLELESQVDAAIARAEGRADG